ncbi:MAG: preprotein translocase subunit SecA [Phycisphaeraceae bacterium]|nr:preprotein translocase subunit SecA [Phycisphaeraceae bacterium]MCB9847963.1 preprotein translocase subunit SecA [Phycisphaeraceae bacterium]
MNQDIPIIGFFIRKIFGARNERVVKIYTRRVEAIASMEPQMRALTDEQIREKTLEFRERVRRGEKLTEVMNEVFAVGREAMDRAVGIRNIFNPEHADRFNPDRLPEAARRLYDETKAKIEATPDADPLGEFLGCTAPQPGWLQVDIPVGLYEAVRGLYPESKPPFRARPFDVQLIGAMVLSQGKIAEMKTGEGKTIVAPLAAYLASLSGDAIHVVTVNDYLVQRDRDWTYPFFHAVGMTVGAIHPMHMQPEQFKRIMYHCDVVYGTTSEFGFDYLRDNMKRSLGEQVQRRRDFAIVDEVDSTLVDEARTPLIISGLAHDDAPRYALADDLARKLVDLHKPWADADKHVEACKMRIKGIEGDIRNARDKSKVPAMQAELKELREKLPTIEAERDQHTQYYEVEMDKKRAALTHDGIEAAQRIAGLGSFYVGENTDLPHLLEQAVRAHVVYTLDRDYIIMPTPDPHTGQTNDTIVIVDVNTGRPMVGRQWSEGLHQAVEAKEGVPIKQETQTVATVTIQNFFKMYKRLAGMTGTADTEAQEFHDIYKLDVVVIPTNKPMVRVDHNDTVFLSEKDKWKAIVDEIKAFHDVGRPVLVGTTSVEHSEMLSRMLAKEHQIKHQVLNAKQHESESQIIAGAGELGAVMIATNMAGRGTDIKLQSVTREELIDHWQRRNLAPRDLTPGDSDGQAREKIYRKIAPRELGIKKQEAESMDAASIELALLRKWTGENTWLDPKRIETMDAAQLRAELDAQDRFLLHRVGWVESIEELGGLHVVGTERHESRRIDNQLRGRSGRQGDRGSSRFFVSMEDDLMKLFAGETTLRILSRLGMKEGDSIEHPMMSKAVERAQRKVEERNFQIRKNILEYDEVMEVQRRGFYGLRQRVLEGRDVKGLIFGYIDDACYDAAETDLDRDYPYERIAERAKSIMNVSVLPERLRGREADEIEQRVKQVAVEDIHSEVSVTIGEYMPEDAIPEDYDLKGLSNWAKLRYGADIKPSELREMTRRQVIDAITQAGHDQINNADISEVRMFLTPDFGAEELRRWMKSRFEVDVPLDSITGLESAEEVAHALAQAAESKYVEREVEHPVDFNLQMTMALMRQSPKEASARLAAWANRRFNIGWDDSVVRTRMPQQLREELLGASRRFVEDGVVEKALDEAMAVRDNDEALNEFMKERLNIEWSEPLHRLEGEERDNAIRARVEGVLRAEMIQFERYVLLEVLDTTWKDHLATMDRLRDTISFRAFSQQDPRIEFKREGARLFEEMQVTIRDQVTDKIFKLQMVPQLIPQQQTQQQRPQPPQQQEQQDEGGQEDGAERQPARRLAGAAGAQAAFAGRAFGASTITGPGFSSGPPAGKPARPQPDPGSQPDDLKPA